MAASNDKSRLGRILRELLPVLCFFVPFLIAAVVFVVLVVLFTIGGCKIDL